MDMGPNGVYQIFQIDGTDTGAVMTKMKDTPHPFWTFYFNVEGIDAAVTRVGDGGGKVLMGPHEVPGNRWIITGQDPQGAIFSLLSQTK